MSGLRTIFVALRSWTLSWTLPPKSFAPLPTLVEVVDDVSSVLGDVPAKVTYERAAINLLLAMRAFFPDFLICSAPFRAGDMTPYFRGCQVRRSFCSIDCSYKSRTPHDLAAPRGRGGRCRKAGPSPMALG